jgi:hypothetical protein
MIKNKSMAIFLAVLTFILGSVLLVSVLFYLLKYPISSLGEHQLYVFSAILISAVLASLVYGRDSSERASKVTKLLHDSLGITIKEDHIWKVLRTIEQLPPFVVNKYISLNINAVEEFEDQIKDYKEEMSDEDLLKIRKIIETPLDDLQILLNDLYLETNMEQFKILAEPYARPLLVLNLEELKKIFK